MTHGTEGLVTIKTDGIINTLAAVLVLFTPMVDPRISVGVGAAFLLAWTLYSLARKGTS